jgi:hypothetical protein
LHSSQCVEQWDICALHNISAINRTVQQHIISMSAIDGVVHPKQIIDEFKATDSEYGAPYKC